MSVRLRADAELLLLMEGGGESRVWRVTEGSARPNLQVGACAQSQGSSGKALPPAVAQGILALDMPFAGPQEAVQASLDLAADD